MKKRHHQTREIPRDPTLKKAVDAQRRNLSEDATQGEDLAAHASEGSRAVTETGEHHSVLATGTDADNIHPVEPSDERLVAHQAEGEPEDTLPDHYDRNK